MNDRQLARIFACRRQVAGLEDEDAWRGFLRQVTGKDSLRAMDAREKGKVIDALHASGAPKAGHKVAPRRAGLRRLPNEPLARKARALWLALYQLGEVSEPSEAALNAFCRRQVGVDSLAWLAPETGFRLIEALKAWCARAGFDLRGVPEVSTINTIRSGVRLRAIDDGWRAKRVLVGVLRRRLRDEGVAVRMEEPGTWMLDDATPADLDREIERLGAKLREAKARREAAVG